MDYYTAIKNELIHNEINKRIKDYSKNKYELVTYYNVGKLLIEAQGGEERAKYGDKIISKYTTKLLNENIIKVHSRILWRCRQFYILNQKVSTLSTQLTWSHCVELLPINNIGEINYYINITAEQNLSVRELREKIKSKEYERLPDSTKRKLINNEKSNVIDFVKNPIIIRNNKNHTILSERALQGLILENIPAFLEELGEGFTFIKNEYKIKIGNTFNYIDLLLFNYKYNSFVVVELKVTELKKEHIGQIQVYMNYIDHNLKETNQDNTIGIIICKQDNEYVIKYCSDNRIISRTYEFV